MWLNGQARHFHGSYHLFESQQQKDHSVRKEGSNRANELNCRRKKNFFLSAENYRNRFLISFHFMGAKMNNLNEKSRLNLCLESYKIKCKALYPNQEPVLELHSRAAPSVEAHHRVNGPDTERNSGGRRTKKYKNSLLITVLKLLNPCIKSTFRKKPETEKI